MASGSFGEEVGVEIHRGLNGFAHDTDLGHWRQRGA